MVHTPVGLARRGEHAAERLRLGDAAVRVPHVAGFREVVDAEAAVDVCVSTAVEQGGSKGTGVRSGGKDEV